MMVGFGFLGLVALAALLASSAEDHVGEVVKLREGGSQLRLIGPHRLPELVPPRAPGPAVFS